MSRLARALGTVVSAFLLVVVADSPAVSGFVPGVAAAPEPIPQPAPAGGLLIDVTTDVPESVVMPVVMVAAGQTSATVPIQGGKPGSGSLFFRSSAGESSIAVTVTAN